MCRLLSICALTLFITLPAAAQDDVDSAGRYSLGRSTETRAQHQRRLQQETARRLILERAVDRATRRDQRIANARAWGISPARPDTQRQNWFDLYWWSLPRIIYLYVDPPADDSPPRAAQRY
ncbi:MAG: hypothetical protein MI757_20575 [Pirellulales bacterium]|nr:hypothetical protein [Pirellulales bacterium]